MKKYLRQLFINVILLWGLAGLVSGVSYANFNQLLLSAFVLSLLQMLLLPLLKLLWTPITLLSLGALKWVPSVVTILVFDWLMDGYSIGRITFPSIETHRIHISQLEFGPIMSIIVFAIGLHMLHKFVTWVLK